jgi:hypothetical protein
MTRTKILTVLGIVAFATILIAIGCTKGTTPIPPPVHDTIYAPKPDTTLNLTKGLLLYLPFSGNIADSSGNNNPTQAVGSVLGYDAHGYANNAFSATGNGERIYVTNNGSIKFDTAFSLSFGFMVNVNKQQSYISMVDPATGRGPSFNIGNTYPYNTNLFCMGIGDTSIGCGNYGQIDNYSIVDTSSWQPVPGAWYSFIAIYNHGALDIYINGSLQIHRKSLGSKVLCCPNSKIVIGSWWDGSPANQVMNMNGKLDNLRLYGRVLTPSEITYLSQHYTVTANSVKVGIKTN